MAQYTGGGGRGEATLFIAPAPLASAVFSGGGGRGESMVGDVPVAPSSGLFAGGSGRGESRNAASATSIPSHLFAGGSGRGETRNSIQPASLATNAFSGGTGRGEVHGVLQPTPIASNIFAGGAGRGEQAMPFTPGIVMLALRAVLDGPYSSSTGLMNDALRTAALVPTGEPYTAQGYIFVSGGGESTTVQVLNTTGNNAIVDWVVVEVRSAVTPATVLASRAALMQRDGDVVAVDGHSPLAFTLPAGTYHVAIRHRNHLGAMSFQPLGLYSSVSSLDLSIAGTATYGTQARKSITGAYPAEALWAGDMTNDGTLQYTGANNDRDPILVAIGGTVPTNTITGYHQADVNMDGSVKYTGVNNDRDPILVNIGGTVPTNVRQAQLP